GLMFKQCIIVLLVYLGAFLFMKTYREIVRHTGLSEAIRIFKTVWLACMVLFLITLLVRSTELRDTGSGEYLRLSYAVVFVHGMLLYFRMFFVRRGCWLRRGLCIGIFTSCCFSPREKVGMY